MIFESALKKLGLKDKEAAIYLACLQLGPSAVQPIARRAKVVRATAYVIIESLMEMGLITKYREGKKTLFSAEPPRQLVRLLEKQKEEIDDKQRDLDKILPELQVFMKGSDDKPTVRYFAGREGLRAMRQEMVMYTQAGDLWRNFTPIDHLDAVFQRSQIIYQQRVAKKINARTIFSTRSPELKRHILEGAYYSEARFIPPDMFPSSSGMTIFRDRIAIGNFTGNLGGVVVESEAMADMMTRLFDLAWRGAEGLDKKWFIFDIRDTWMVLNF